MALSNKALDILFDVERAVEKEVESRGLKYTDETEEALREEIQSIAEKLVIPHLPNAKLSYSKDNAAWVPAFKIAYDMTRTMREKVSSDAYAAAQRKLRVENSMQPGRHIIGYMSKHDIVNLKGAKDYTFSTISKNRSNSDCIPIYVDLEEAIEFNEQGE